MERKEWEKADSETFEIILEITNRKEEGWLDSEAITGLPCEYLREIDQLWKNYSQGRFGFEEQSEVWHRYSTYSKEYDSESYKRFGEALGWYSQESDNWLSIDQRSFDLIHLLAIFLLGVNILVKEIVQVSGNSEKKELICYYVVIHRFAMIVKVLTSNLPDKYDDGL